MPWQMQAALIGGELLDDGRPAYRQVVFTVPRQQGKTTLILSWEIQRAIGWDGPQRIAYSAQTGKDSRDKLVNDQFPLLERNRKVFGIKQLNRGVGNEGVLWLNGSRLVVLSSNLESGHGKTLDLAIKDELFADADDRRDQAIIPAMQTRPAAQVVTASTAGTDASIPFNALVRRGRAAVEKGRTDGIAYFEWSADPGDDIESPDVWRRTMPALGHTCSVEVVRDAFETMSTSEFMRAFLNIPTKHESDRVWTAATWASVCDPQATPAGRLAVGIDATPDRRAGAIAVAGGGVIEVATDDRGRRLPVRIVDLAADAIRIARAHNAPVAVDPSGPAGYVLPDLEEAGVEVIKVTGQAMGQACGALHTAVEERTLRVRTNPELSAAVANADTLTRGDVWVWGRKVPNADVSPLVAATLAHWGALTREAPDEEYGGTFVGLEDIEA